jgi:ParB/RepB/Spo0J family partition protein
MIAASNGRQFAMVDLALVDDPHLPARATMDAEKLDELTESIRAQGVIEPLILVKRDGRYEVVAGHRRRLAALRAELVTVPALIAPDDERTLEAIKLHENTKREDLNAGDEAIYFAQLLESLAGGDIDALAELVKETRYYVESRLALLRGDDRVLAALCAREINFAVANELNRIADAGYRLNFLEAAVKGGATARLVREWRLGYERMQQANPAGDSHKPAASAMPAQPAGSVLNCYFCDSPDDPHTFELVYLHRHCVQALERVVGIDRLRGVFAKRAEPPAAAAGGDRA